MIVKKKILHISQSTGGVGTYVTHIINHTDPNLFEFVMIAPADDRFERFCSDRNIPFYAVDLHRNINPLSNIKALLRIRSVVKKERPDTIHAHSARGGFLGRAVANLLKVKVIYTPHAFSYLSFTGLKRTIFYSLEMMARKWTTLLLAISYSEANRAVYELGYNKKQVKTILNAIPVNESHINYTDTPLLKIGMIGRLTNQKNHFLFLELAEQLLKKYPLLKFSILGAGIHDELADDIDNLLITNQLVGKVEILHWGDSSTSQQFLNELDIFVMPSVFEGLPFSLLEAMSHGIPCIVSKVDGNNDVINNNENGFSCSDINEFVYRTELLINDVNLRQRIGMAGFEYVKNNHSILLNTKKLETLYSTL